jgi:hypothetical protein
VHPSESYDDIDIAHAYNLASRLTSEKPCREAAAQFEAFLKADDCKTARKASQPTSFLTADAPP